jgi:flagellar basal-body rod modification protein FlgD
MVDSVNNKNEFSSLVNGLNQQSTTEKNKDSTKASEVNEREDFLKILVSQLENQDPLNPMDNDRFAVDLAQFSQLEQLVNLNNKFSGAGNMGNSLTQYLGNTVSWEANSISLSDETKQLLNITLPSNARELNIDLVNDVGSVVDSIKLEDLSSGKYEFNLSDYTDSKGNFNLNINAVDENGADINLQKEFSGSVTGFIPGAESILLVGDSEVNLAEVTKVVAPKEDAAVI